MIKIATLIAFATIVIAASICRPSLLVDNTFLRGFITFELLNLLAVILTVTLASVANIHLSLNRIVAALFKDKAKGENLAAAVRKEINQNAWLLLWLFVGCVACLFAKGALSDGAHVEAFLNGVALTILLANVLTLYDIYSVVYTLVSQEGKSAEATRRNGDGSL